MDTVKVGFVGCGGIAQYHFGHMEKMDNARVVAVCDKVAERAGTAAERFGATPYASYAEMFEKEELDAVFVCVEPSAHDGMEMLAIEKGCHLFVQKPMTLDLAYARRVRDALAARNLVSAVGLQCRYADTLPRVKGWVEKQQIGMVTMTRLGGLPMVWWWRESQHSGGQIVEQTIHNYDILRYVLGEVKSVCGMGRKGVVTDVENYDVEDASAVVLHFENGVIATAVTGCFSRGGAGHSACDFFTRDGVLKYGLGGDFTIKQGTMTITGKASNDYGQECDDTFIQAILENDPSLVLSPYADAYRSLELTLAATESVRRGGELITLG